MAEKAKKTTTKKAVSKKTTVKTTSTKKTPAKKAETPVVEMHPCGCDKHCPCGGNCQCTKHHCSFWKKLIVALIFFALGFAAAKMVPCPKRGKMPKPEFNNGCLVVRCPKMAEKLPQIDVNSDGCIDKAEFKAFKKEMRRERRMHRAPRPEMAE